MVLAMLGGSRYFESIKPLKTKVKLSKKQKEKIEFMNSHNIDIIVDKKTNKPIMKLVK